MSTNGKSFSCYVSRVCASALALLITAGCGRAGRQEPIGHSVYIVHASDPHLFVPAGKDLHDMQEQKDEEALTAMLKRIPSLRDGGAPPALLVLSGDLGVDPCPSKKKGEITVQKCFDDADIKEKDRATQITKTAAALGTSPIRDIYLVAGNNDIALEDSGDQALNYFNKFIEDVQSKITKGNKQVLLHNLTACYASGGDISSCSADVPGTPYRLVGLPSYSFKTADANGDSGPQAQQFAKFHKLVDQAQQGGKTVIVVSHIPEIDDPFAAAELCHNTGCDPGIFKSPGSAWKIDKKLLDDWNGLLASDSVAGVLAGHLHDSHRETYRQPYAWSTLQDHAAAFRKLFLAPPLAIKNQFDSPIQARGLSLVRLDSDRIEPLLYWYNSETREFKADPHSELRPHPPRGWRLWPSLRWVWGLDGTDSKLIRFAIVLIALLTAFLTVVAIWQIPPPADNVLIDKKTKDQNPENTPPDASPYASKFGKTVIAGLGGLVFAEVAKTLGNQPSSTDTRWYYIAWFIIFFFAWLGTLNGIRAIVEGLRARIVVVHQPLPRVLGICPKCSAWIRLLAWLRYWFLGFVHWVTSLRVPVITVLDTFMNLIQGKNQTNTQALSNTVIAQQRNIVRVADLIRTDLTALISQQVIYNRHHPPNASPPHVHDAEPPRVRVNISVLSGDQASLFYISHTAGSTSRPFDKTSVAWLSVFTGTILWYRSSYKLSNKYADIVLFDNSECTINGKGANIWLKDQYQARKDDYEAFAVFPVPWPRRASGEGHVKGAIHISFGKECDFNLIWETPDAALTSPPQPPQEGIYETPEKMLGHWCIDPDVRTTLKNSASILTEVLHGFNEEIFKSYIQPDQWD